jgi:hypothetical protein
MAAGVHYYAILNYLYPTVVTQVNPLVIVDNMLNKVHSFKTIVFHMSGDVFVSVVVEYCLLNLYTSACS